eukprot:CAMPEP_0185851914 /NCGR_PEP_ID=MMETSP1354-20130828/12367_1 /TAXON_ID=708628 /ORGANISM="Erythrolobus madagascarensis, Strain CCMP3276" /LENGTH=67 /DNA_ID=CAMNT_0028553025 /DNA_START=129 /DNA_END=332 /DNA_ORIENTATION=-
MEESQEEGRRRFARKWNFDIEGEAPLEGGFSWSEVVDTKHITRCESAAQSPDPKLKSKSRAVERSAD